MTAQGVAALLVAGAGLLAAYTAYRKFRPERNDITITTADRVNAMTLRFAGVVDQDNDDLRGEVAALKAEFTQYRADTEARHAEYAAALRAEKAEKQRYQYENEQLKARVTELESEVRHLKKAQSDGPQNGPHTPA